MINCCGRNQRTEISRVKTLEQKELENKINIEKIQNNEVPENFLLSILYDEYIEVLNRCSNCGSMVINRERYYPYSDKTIPLSPLRNKAAKRYLKKLYFQEKRYKESHPDKRMYLNYSEYGKTKKCYSNLSGLKIGLIDPTEGLVNDSFVA